MDSLGCCICFLSMTFFTYGKLSFMNTLCDHSRLPTTWITGTYMLRMMYMYMFTTCPVPITTCIHVTYDVHVHVHYLPSCYYI